MKRTQKKQAPQVRKKKKKPQNVKTQRVVVNMADLMRQMGPIFDGSQTTPKEITPRIRQFALEAGCEDPIRIPVKPLGPTLRCHYNVADFCREYPDAEPVHGWVVWESAQILEAEFHCIIRHRGELFCITQPADGEAELVFMIDPKRRPEFVIEDDGAHIGKSYINIRFPKIEFHIREFMVDPKMTSPLKITLGETK